MVPWYLQVGLSLFVSLEASSGWSQGSLPRQVWQIYPTGLASCHHPSRAESQSSWGACCSADAQRGQGLPRTASVLTLSRGGEEMKKFGGRWIIFLFKNTTVTGPLPRIQFKWGRVQVPPKGHQWWLLTFKLLSELGQIICPFEHFRVGCFVTVGRLGGKTNHAEFLLNQQERSTEKSICYKMRATESGSNIKALALTGTCTPLSSSFQTLL